MRNISFRTTDEKTRDELSQKVFDFIKKSRFDKDYELRDIILAKCNDKDSSYIFYLSISDCVPVTFALKFSNVEKDENTEAEMIIDSDMFSEALLIPSDVKVSINWEKETVNRYKVVKTNHDVILDMVKQGVNPKEISKRFAINWSGKDSMKMLEKEKSNILVQ